MMDSFVKSVSFFVDGYYVVMLDGNAIGGAHTEFVCLICYLNHSETLFEEGWQISHGRDPGEALPLGLRRQECFLCARRERAFEQRRRHLGY